MTKNMMTALEFIKNFIEKNGYSPSYREIGEGIGCDSKSGVHKLVVQLAAARLIDYRPGASRSITIHTPLASLADYQIMDEVTRRGWVACEWHREQGEKPILRPLRNEPF